MAKHLSSYVHVHQDDGSVKIYGPKDDVPAEDAEKIGDHAWVDDEPDDESDDDDDTPRVQVDDPEKAKNAASRRRTSGKPAS